jgi:hypothetical protein
LPIPRISDCAGSERPLITGRINLRQEFTRNAGSWRPCVPM